MKTVYTYENDQLMFIATNPQNLKGWLEILNEEFPASKGYKHVVKDHSDG